MAVGPRILTIRHSSDGSQFPGGCLAFPRVGHPPYDAEARARPSTLCAVLPELATPSAATQAPRRAASVPVLLPVIVARVTSGTDETGGAQGGAARRPVLKGLAGLGALGVGGVAARGLLAGEPQSGRRGALALSGHGESDLDELSVPITDDLVRRVDRRLWRSGRLDTSSMTMVGFVWAADATDVPTFRVKVRQDGRWGDWLALAALHDVADAETDEGATRSGTPVLWVGRANGVEIEVSGSRPPGLELVLLYPRRRSTDSGLSPVNESARRATGAARDGGGLRPTVLSRAEWGADERWTDGPPTYNDAMQQVHVHHTASGNDYAEEDVPALIRGMYRYHTHNLGWSDIGYNFMVDRFGRIWEGRAGGIRRRVRGAHTLGFNATSTGVAAIGNFEEVVPAKGIIEGVARLAAWKVHGFGGRPRGRVSLESEGSDRFPPGQTVTLPVIDGHRDTNDTACPGQHLYDELPRIRRRTRTLIKQATAPPVVIVAPAVLTGVTQLGGTVAVDPGAYDPAGADLSYRWMRNGETVPGVTGASYPLTAADVGCEMSVEVTASAAGRTAVTQTLVAGAPVTAQPIVQVNPRSGRRRVSVQVRVLPPDGVTTTVTGQVMVRLRGRQMTVDLVEGSAVAQFRGVRSGSWTVAAHFLGGDIFVPASARATVEVQRH